MTVPRSIPGTPGLPEQTNGDTTRLEQDATTVVRLDGDTKIAEIHLDSSERLQLSEFGAKRK